MLQSFWPKKRKPSANGIHVWKSFQSGAKCVRVYVSGNRANKSFTNLLTNIDATSSRAKANTHSKWKAAWPHGSMAASTLCNRSTLYVWLVYGVCSRSLAYTRHCNGAFHAMFVPRGNRFLENWEESRILCSRGVICIILLLPSIAIRQRRRRRRRHLGMVTLSGSRASSQFRMLISESRIMVRFVFIEQLYFVMLLQ